MNAFLFPARLADVLEGPARRADQNAGRFGIESDFRRGLIVERELEIGVSGAGYFNPALSQNRT